MALSIATAILVSLNSNCRKTVQPQNRERNTMNNMSDHKTGANDSLALHRRAIVVDMHADTTQRLVDENVDLEQRLSDGHFDAVRAKEGGLDAQFFSIWVEPQLLGGGGESAMKRADGQSEPVRSLAANPPG